MHRTTRDFSFQWTALSLMTLFYFFCSPCIGEQLSTGLKSRLRFFDMGTADSPVESGYVQVTEKTIFAPEIGYGFTQRAEGSFDRRKTTRPDRIRRDGVFTSEELEFKIALAPGNYYVRVTFGDPEGDRRETSVYAAGIELGKDLVTQRTWWEGEATSLLAAGTVQLSENLMSIRLFSNEAVCSIQSIQVLPTSEPPFNPYRDKQIENANRAIKPFLEAYRSKEFNSAVEEIRRNSPPRSGYLNAWMLTWIASRIDYVGSTIELLKSSISLLETSIIRNPDNISAHSRRLINQDFLTALNFIDSHGYSKVRKETGTGWGERRKNAQNLLSMIPPDDPFYAAAQFHLGRILYWIGQKKDNQVDLKKADEHFRKAVVHFPEAPILRMYRGEKIPWGEEYKGWAENAPQWALRQREALARLNSVIDYWIDERQVPTGEFGGGWGDDVEMMNWWLPAAFITGRPKIISAMKRLAEGVWNKSGIITDGFFRGLAPVQYSAELTSDSQPHLLALDFGNPTYFQRCFATSRLMKNVWTGINGKGRRHFKSLEIGSQKVGRDLKTALDVPYMARAIQPAHWAAWYSKDPQLIKLFREWSDAWVVACMRTDKGKPRWVPPAAITYATEELGGYENAWFNPKIDSAYFSFPGGIQFLFEHLLATYILTSEERYLSPIEGCLDLMNRLIRKEKLIGGAGGEQWAAKILLNYRPLDEVWAKWRMVSGKTKYDTLLKRHGSPYIRWYLTQDKRHLVEGCDRTLESLSWNYDLLTKEVRYTDRVNVKGASHLLAMATGGTGLPGFYPTWKVTWETGTKQFAALVLHDPEQNSLESKRLVRVLVYSFESHPIKVRMRSWSLTPGVYEFKRGVDGNKDNVMDQIEEKKKVYLYGPGTPVEFQVLPDKLQEISLRLIHPIKLKQNRPDIAVSSDGLMVYPPQPALGERVFIGARIYNIGNRSAKNVLVQILEKKANREILLKEKSLREVLPTKHLHSGSEIIWHEEIMSSAEKKLIVRIKLNDSDLNAELTQENNQFEQTILIGDKKNTEFIDIFQQGKLTDTMVPAWTDLASAYYSPFESPTMVTKSKARLERLRQKDFSDDSEMRMVLNLYAYIHNLTAPKQLVTRTEHFLEMSLTRPLNQLGHNRPDIAISDYDIAIFPPRPVKGERVFIGVQVHNIGAGPAQDVQISIYENRVSEKNLLKQKWIDLPKRLDSLKPRVKWVWFDYQTFFMEKQDTYIIAVAKLMSKKEGQELTVENNRAIRKFRLGNAPNDKFAHIFQVGKLTDSIVPIWIELVNHFHHPDSYRFSQDASKRYQQQLQKIQVGASPEENALIHQLLAYLGQSGIK